MASHPDAATNELILITPPIQDYPITKTEELQVVYDIARSMRWLHANNTIHGHLASESISIDHEYRADLGCLNWSSGHYGLDDRGEPISFEGDVYDFGVLCSSRRWTSSPAFRDFHETIVSADASDRPTFAQIVEFFESEFPDQLETYDDLPLAPELRDKIRPDRLHELEAAISGQPFEYQCARVLTFFVTPSADVGIAPRDDFNQSLNSLSYFPPNTSVIAPDSRQPPNLVQTEVNVSSFFQRQSRFRHDGRRVCSEKCACSLDRLRQGGACDSE
jgi:serine/threonine protein kinase